MLALGSPLRDHNQNRLICSSFFLHLTESDTGVLSSDLHLFVVAIIMTESTHSYQLLNAMIFRYSFFILSLYTLHKYLLTCGKEKFKFYHLVVGNLYEFEHSNYAIKE